VDSKDYPSLLSKLSIKYKFINNRKAISLTEQETENVLSCVNCNIPISPYRVSNEMLNATTYCTNKNINVKNCYKCKTLIEHKLNDNVIDQLNRKPSSIQTKPVMNVPFNYDNCKPVITQQITDQNYLTTNPIEYAHLSDNVNDINEINQSYKPGNPQEITANDKEGNKPSIQA
jgi:Zn-finger protein